MPWSSKSYLPLKETTVWSLGQEDPLEEGMTTHSSILAWRIPLTEGPGGLQSMGSQTVGQDWATNGQQKYSDPRSIVGNDWWVRSFKLSLTPAPTKTVMDAFRVSFLNPGNISSLFLWNLAAEKGSDGEINGWSSDSKDGGGHHNICAPEKAKIHPVLIQAN